MQLLSKYFPLLLTFSSIVWCTVVRVLEGNNVKQRPVALEREISSLADIDIDQFRLLQSRHAISSQGVTQAYLDRIHEVNHIFHSVSELNPDAISVARNLDAERTAGQVRGPLHGVPILLKDNIATSDRMNCTAGSLALLGARASREATVARKLRDAGAIILGKATMGEWAQMRSMISCSSHGWSPYGGQSYGVYYPQQNPFGSSSGSAVAVALGLSIGTLATETSGSILLPAEKSGIVGIKPTVGLTSRSMVIPISLRQDSVGPHAKTVKNAAYLLSAIAGKDSADNWTAAQPFDTVPDYVKACNASALREVRLGIPRNGIDYYLTKSTGSIMIAFEKAVKLMRDAGATVLEVDFAAFDPPTFNQNSDLVLDLDFAQGLKDYLSQLSTNPANIHSLEDLIEYTKTNPQEGWPDHDIGVWERAVRRNLTTCSSESYEAFEANRRMAEEDGITGALDRYSLDALIMPTFASFRLPAIAGLPVITVPLGYFPAETEVVWDARGEMVDIAPGIPFGISFLGKKWSEETLIGLAYAFERRTQVWRKGKPLVSPTVELSNLLDLHADISDSDLAQRDPVALRPWFEMDELSELSVDGTWNLSSHLLGSTLVSV